MGKHTLILIQPENKASSRSYYDYESVTEAMEGILKLYESELKSQFSNKRNIEYSTDDFGDWVDSLPDLAALVFDNGAGGYKPNGKDWIKEKVVLYLEKLESA